MQVTAGHAESLARADQQLSHHRRESIPSSKISTLDGPPPGYTVSKHLGVVQGLVFRASTWAADPTSMLLAARAEAFQKMREAAESAGADAVLGLKYDTSSVNGAGGTEIVCFGTAVGLADCQPQTNETTTTQQQQPVFPGCTASDVGETQEGRRESVGSFGMPKPVLVSVREVTVRVCSWVLSLRLHALADPDTPSH